MRICCSSYQYALSWILVLASILLGGAYPVSAAGKAPRRAPMRLVLQSQRTLAPGVTYEEYRTTGRRPVHVHAVKVDRTVDGNAIRVVKGQNQSVSREQLRAMAERYEISQGDAVMAIVNANFWAAVRNNPIGPCVVDGEVVEMNPHKKWSSAFFDVQNRMLIDTFRIAGRVIVGADTFHITSTNRRLDTTGVVVYNKYGGTTVPFVTPDQLEWLWKQAEKERPLLADDSTEIAISEQQMRSEMERAHLEQHREHPMLKLQVRYLRLPSVNRSTPCRIVAIDTGIVTTPLRGAVVSLPRAAFSGRLPRVGDTIHLEFTTNVHQDFRFMNAVSGTPRLVRNGVARHEAKQEGSTARRFIGQHLARTALGTDRTGSTLILVVAEPSRRDRKTYGATLDQMANIMDLLGAEHAVNLDGGGSTGMVVEDRHVFYEQPVDTRPVSVGLAVVRLQHVLRALQYSR